MDEHHLLIIRGKMISVLCILMMKSLYYLLECTITKGGYAGVYGRHGEVELNNFVIKTRKERD